MVFDLLKACVIGEIHRRSHPQAGTSHVFSPDEAEDVVIAAEIRRQLIVVILEAVDQLTIGIKNLKTHRQRCGTGGATQRGREF